MLNVFLTVDVEIWCDGWSNIDTKFSKAFQSYILGNTSQGKFGLPFQFQVLNDHGLTGVFFVEPLFSARFGIQPLADIVGMTLDARQEIQMHLHTEWADEALEPLLSGLNQKKQHLRYFNLSEQSHLIKSGAAMLRDAGTPVIDAFRAGSFGFNADTLCALSENGIPFDSSYNATLFGPDSGVLPGTLMTEPTHWNGIHEFPMAVFDDGTRALRHVQLTSCSLAEMEGLLWQALEKGRQSFVLLSHGFELLNLAKDRPDPIVVDRFRKLCAFLDRNRDCFNVRGFKGMEPADVSVQPPPLTSPLFKTGLRMMQQLYRRRYG